MRTKEKTIYAKISVDKHYILWYKIFVLIFVRLRMDGGSDFQVRGSKGFALHTLFALYVDGTAVSIYSGRTF